MQVREFESQGPVRHELVKRLHERFNDEGIEIPFPIRTVLMPGADGA
jgi:small-conductance mechanosensitive channel